MNNNVKTTHGIRKYKIGVASVVLGTVIFLANHGSGEVKAAEVDTVGPDTLQQTTQVNTNLKNENLTKSETPVQSNQHLQKNVDLKTNEGIERHQTKSIAQPVKHEASQMTQNEDIQTTKVANDVQPTISPRSSNPQPQIQKASPISQDTINNTFKHIAFVSKLNNQVKSGTLIGNVLSQQVKAGNPIVKIYEAMGHGLLNPSVFADTTNTKAFKDITPKMVNNIYYTNNGYQMDIEDLSKNYVVVTEGKYAKDAHLLKYQTQLIGYPNMFSGYRTAHMGWTNVLKFYKNNAAGYGTTTSNLDKDDFIVNDEKSKEILKGKENTRKTDSWNDGNIKIVEPKKDPWNDGNIKIVEPKKEQLQSPKKDPWNDGNIKIVEPKKEQPQSPKKDPWNDGNIKIIEPKKETPNVDSDDFILKDEDLNKILKGEPKAPKKDTWNDGNIKIIEPKKEKEQPKNEMPQPNGPSEKENKPQPKDKMETPKPEVEKKQEMIPKKEHSVEKTPKNEAPKILEPEVEKKAPHMERQSDTNLPKAHLESEMHPSMNKQYEMHLKMMTPQNTHKENKQMKSQDSEHKNDKMLPETGHDSSTQTTGIIGAFLTIFGLATLIKRRKHSKQ
ncbi:fibrinogen-binding adhesin SdrG C-terminal domain-containing protein [Staphylococcus chromogenes]|uniref:fibrinogen-binding adhesin SdrG C-terminal domain-containing protein n=1 Tax=Staphylococcus chromogenes TaxID=46126 RepID=UPI003B0050E9